MKGILKKLAIIVRWEAVVFISLMLSVGVLRAVEVLVEAGELVEQQQRLSSSEEALEIEGTISVVGASAVLLLGDEIALENSGSISTFGEGAHGIEVIGTDILLLNWEEINAHGSSGDSIYSSGVGARIDNRGRLLSRGGHGIEVRGAGSEVFNSGEIFARGSDSVGILISVSEGRVTIDNDGRIESDAGGLIRSTGNSDDTLILRTMSSFSYRGNGRGRIDLGLGEDSVRVLGNIVIPLESTELFSGVEHFEGQDMLRFLEMGRSLTPSLPVLGATEVVGASHVATNNDSDFSANDLVPDSVGVRSTNVVDLDTANTHYGIGHGEILNILPRTNLVRSSGVASNLQITANGVTFTNNGSLYISGPENASTGSINSRAATYSGISVSGENTTINNNGTIAITTFGQIGQAAIIVEDGRSLTLNNRGTLFIGPTTGVTGILLGAGNARLIINNSGILYLGAGRTFSSIARRDSPILPTIQITLQAGTQIFNTNPSRNPVNPIFEFDTRTISDDSFLRIEGSITIPHTQAGFSSGLPIQFAAGIDADDIRENYGFLASEGSFTIANNIEDSMTRVLAGNGATGMIGTGAILQTPINAVRVLGPNSMLTNQGTIRTYIGPSSIVGRIPATGLGESDNPATVGFLSGANNARLDNSGDIIAVYDRGPGHQSGEAATAVLVLADGVTVTNRQSGRIIAGVELNAAGAITRVVDNDDAFGVGSSTPSNAITIRSDGVTVDNDGLIAVGLGQLIDAQGDNDTTLILRTNSRFVVSGDATGRIDLGDGGGDLVQVVGNVTIPASQLAFFAGVDSFGAVDGENLADQRFIVDGVATAIDDGSGPLRQAVLTSPTVTQEFSYVSDRTAEELIVSLGAESTINFGTETALLRYDGAQAAMTADSDVSYSVINEGTLTATLDDDDDDVGAGQVIDVNGLRAGHSFILDNTGGVIRTTVNAGETGRTTHGIRINNPIGAVTITNAPSGGSGGEIALTNGVTSHGILIQRNRTATGLVTINQFGTIRVPRGGNFIQSTGNGREILNLNTNSRFIYADNDAIAYRDAYECDTCSDASSPGRINLGGGIDEVNLTGNLSLQVLPGTLFRNVEIFRVNGNPVIFFEDDDVTVDRDLVPGSGFRIAAGDTVNEQQFLDRFSPIGIIEAGATLNTGTNSAVGISTMNASLDNAGHIQVRGSNDAVNVSTGGEGVRINNSGTILVTGSLSTADAIDIRSLGDNRISLSGTLSVQGSGLLVRGGAGNETIVLQPGVNFVIPSNGNINNRINLGGGTNRIEVAAGDEIFLFPRLEDLFAGSVTRDIRGMVHEGFIVAPGETLTIPERRAGGGLSLGSLAGTLGHIDDYRLTLNRSSGIYQTGEGSRLIIGSEEAITASRQSVWISANDISFTNNGSIIALSGRVTAGSGLAVLGGGAINIAAQQSIHPAAALGDNFMITNNGLIDAFTGDRHGGVGIALLNEDLSGTIVNNGTIRATLLGAITIAAPTMPSREPALVTIHNRGIIEGRYPIQLSADPNAMNRVRLLSYPGSVLTSTRPERRALFGAAGSMDSEAVFVDGYIPAGNGFFDNFGIHEYLVQSTSTVTVPLVVADLGGGGTTRRRVTIENGGQLHPEGSNQTGVMVTRGGLTIVNNQGRIQATGTGHGIHATAGRIEITNNGIIAVDTGNLIMTSNGNDTLTLDSASQFFYNGNGAGRINLGTGTNTVILTGSVTIPVAQMTLFAVEMGGTLNFNTTNGNFVVDGTPTLPAPTPSPPAVGFTLFADSTTPQTLGIADTTGRIVSEVTLNTAAAVGVTMSGSGTQLDNNGTIISTASNGVVQMSAARAQLNNTGMIMNTSGDGVRMSGINTMVENLGIISTATGSGIRIMSSRAEVVNRGSIRVTTGANGVGGIHSSSSGTLAISNRGDITVSGSAHGIYSTAGSGTITITNSGTIAVDTGNLIETGASNDTLILETGTMFTLNGGNSNDRINLGGGTNNVQIIGNIVLPANMMTLFAGTPNITTSGFINIQPPIGIDIGAPPLPPPAIPEAPEEPPPTPFTVRQISIDNTYDSAESYILDTEGNDVTVEADARIDIAGRPSAVEITAPNTRLVNNGILTTTSLTGASGQGPPRVVHINVSGAGQVTVVNNGTMRSIIGEGNGASVIGANFNNTATVNIINNGSLFADDNSNAIFRAGIRTRQTAPVRIVNNGNITVQGAGNGIYVEVSDAASIVEITNNGSITVQTGDLIRTNAANDVLTLQTRSRFSCMTSCAGRIDLGTGANSVILEGNILVPLAGMALFEVDENSLMPTISGSGMFVVNTNPPDAPAFVPPALPPLEPGAITGFRLSSTTETMTQSLSTIDDIGTVDSTATLNTAGTIGVNMTGERTVLNNRGEIITTTANAVQIAANNTVVENFSTASISTATGNGIRITSAVTGMSTINNRGVIEITGNAALGTRGAIHSSTAGTLEITNSGSITARGAAHGIYSDATTGTLRITNRGTITARGAAHGIYSTATSGTLMITNSGTITVDTGNLIQTGASNDTLILQTGTTFTLNGGGNTGRINLGGGMNEVRLEANLMIPAAQSIFFAGENINFTGAGILIVPEPTGFNLTGTNNTATQMLNSPADDNSINTVTTGATLNTGTSIGVDIMANNARLNNLGTIQTTTADAVQITGDTATVDNRSTASITTATGSGIRIMAEATGTSIANAGMISVTGNAGSMSGAIHSSTTGTLRITNSGTITAAGATHGIYSDATSGTLTITNSGTITVDTGNLIQTGNSNDTLILQTGTVLRFEGVGTNRINLGGGNNIVRVVGNVNIPATQAVLFNGVSNFYAGVDGTTALPSDGNMLTVITRASIGSTTTEQNLNVADSETTVADGATVNVAGMDAISIMAANNQLINQGTVMTTGNNADAISVATNIDSARVNNESSLSTSGDNSAGIRAEMGTSNAIIDNSGNISTSGADSQGIVASGDNAMINNRSGAMIMTSGTGSPHGIEVSGNGSVINNAGAISVANMGNGIHITTTVGQATTITNSGNITVADGLLIQAGAGNDTLNLEDDSSLTVTGTGSVRGRIDLGSGTNVVNVNGLVTAPANSRTLFANLADTTINFTGTNSRFVVTGGFDISTAVTSQQTLANLGSLGTVTSSGSIITTGTAVVVSGASVDVNNAGTISATGAGAHGISVTGTGTNAVIDNRGSIIATGAGSHGILVAATSGDITIDNRGSIAVGDGDLIQSGASNDTLILRTGTALSFAGNDGAGRIDLGGGNNIVRVVGNVTIPEQQMTLFTNVGNFYYGETGTTTTENGNNRFDEPAAPVDPVDPVVMGFTLTMNTTNMQILGMDDTFGIINSGVMLAVSGSEIGVNMTAARTELRNSGTVSSVSGNAVQIARSGSAVANRSGASITTATGSGIRIMAAATGTAITNAGTISVTGNAGGMSGAIHSSTGTLQITNSGSITASGATHGIYSDATSGTLTITNSGTIGVNTGNLVQTADSNDTLILQTGTAFTLNGGVATDRITLGGGTDTVRVTGVVNIPVNQRTLLSSDIENVYYGASGTSASPNTNNRFVIPGFTVTTNLASTQTLDGFGELGTITAAGSIRTTAGAAHGVVVSAASVDVINMGSINATGAAAHGISVTGTGTNAVIDNRGSISATGTGSHGILVAATSGDITIDNRGSITVEDGDLIRSGASNDTLILRTGTALSFVGDGTGRIDLGGGDNIIRVIGNVIIPEQQMTLFRGVGGSDFRYGAAPSNASMPSDTDRLVPVITLTMPQIVGMDELLMLPESTTVQISDDGVSAVRLASGATLDNEGRLETSGNNSPGVEVEMAAMDAEIDNGGTITTTGSGSHGVVVRANASDIRVNNNDTITTTGSGSHGVEVESGATGITVDNNNNIQTGVAGQASQGVGSHGVRILSANSTLQNDGQIITHGNQSYGVEIGAMATGSELTNGTPSGTQGRIETRGDNSHGVLSAAADVTITNNQLIQTRGSSAYGIRTTGVDNTIINNERIETFGAGAYAIYVEGTDVTNNGEMITRGDGAHGFVRGGDMTSEISFTNGTDGIVQALGQGADAICVGSARTDRCTGEVTSVSPSAIDIVNNGTLNVEEDGDAIYIDSDNAVTIENNGLIEVNTGNIIRSVGMSDDTLILRTDSTFVYRGSRNDRVDLGEGNDTVRVVGNVYIPAIETDLFVNTENIYAGATGMLDINDPTATDMFTVGARGGIVSVDTTLDAANGRILGLVTDDIHSLVDRQLDTSGFELSGSSNSLPKRGGWIAARGATSGFEQGGGTVPYTYNRYSTVTGYQGYLKDSLVGVFFGAMNSEFDTDVVGWEFDSNGVFGGFYSSFGSQSGWQFSGTIIAGYERRQIDRTVNVFGLTGTHFATAGADANNRFFSPRITLNAPVFRLPAKVGLRPSVILSYAESELSGFTETSLDDPSVELRYEDRKSRSASTKFQLALSRTLGERGGIALRFGVEGRIWESDAALVEEMVTGRRFPLNVGGGGQHDVASGFIGLSLNYEMRNGSRFSVNFEANDATDSESAQIHYNLPF